MPRHAFRRAADHTCQGRPEMSWKRPSKRRVRAIRDRLRQLYGRPVDHPHGDPVHELVKTILSQNTSDTNRDLAYGRLRDRFDTWEQIRDAPVAEVAEAIRPGGLSVTKAPRIQAALGGSGDPIDLSWLRDAPRGGGTRLLDLAAGRGTQDGRLRPALLLRASRDPGGHARSPRRWALGTDSRRRLVRPGARRDSARDRPRGRLRAAHQPDRPRARRLPAEAAVRAVRAAPHVPLLATARR